MQGIISVTWLVIRVLVSMVMSDLSHWTITRLMPRRYRATHLVAQLSNEPTFTACSHPLRSMQNYYTEFGRMINANFEGQFINLYNIYQFLSIMSNAGYYLTRKERRALLDCLSAYHGHVPLVNHFTSLPDDTALLVLKYPAALKIIYQYTTRRQ